MAEEAQTPEQDPGFIELREAYESGELIVFVGAGVSVGAGLPSRGDLVAILTDRARAQCVDPKVLAEVEALVAKDRYIDALSELAIALGPAEFGTAIERAVDDRNVNVPEAASAIAALAPRLRAVLTTNLDHLLERAFSGRWPMSFRAPGDLAARRGYILKLHGTLFDRESWVMTREQYDRAMYADPRMATIFTALFHTCPILFVGVGPVDAEFEQLLVRVSTLTGTQPPRHFAFVPAEQVTPSWRRRIEGAGVRLIPYPNADGTHGEVVRLLRALAETCATAVAEPTISTKAPHDSNASPEDSLLAGVPPRWARCLRQFLVSYLGTPEHPVVFCGRTAILEELTTWQRAKAPARRLLMAPGGRGKSALLVHFTLKLAAEGVAVAWVPVSVRFGLQQSNAVWAALAGRLAWLHGESSPPATLNESQVLDRIHDHLRRPLPDGRPRVVLLDGLDEAGWEVDASMLPVRLAENTRLLVAVRGEGERDGMRWLHRLGWEREGLACRIALLPLDRAAVSEALANLEQPIETFDAARVRQELYRVSAGDPLVLQLMLDELRSAGGAGVLGRWQGMSPGLKGYMEGWWEEQRTLWGEHAPQHDQGLGILLDLLAAALAPLTDDDLLALAPEELPNHHVLESAIRPLARLVIGDGQHGWVFTHPGLTSYFWKRLPLDRRAAIEERFVARGRAVLAELDQNRRSPRTAPRYVVTTQRAYVERAQAGVDALLALVRDGWRAAWEATEGVLAGFLADMRTAWRKLSEAQAQEARAGRLPRRWVEEVRCALVQASIGSLNERLPEGLIKLLLEEKRWTPGQALLHVQQCPDAHDRGKLLKVIFTHLPDTLLDEALEAACAAANERWGSFEALKELIPRLTARQPEALLARLERLPWALSTLQEMAKHCTGALREALVSDLLGRVRQLKEPAVLAQWLLRVAEDEGGERRAALVGEAWEAARRIERAQQRHYDLSHLLPFVPEALREEVERAALTAALATYEEPSHHGEERTADVVRRLRMLKLSAGLEREAREAAWKLMEGAVVIERIPALLALAEWAAGDELRQTLCRLLEILPRLGDQEQRARRLLEVIKLDPPLLPLVLAEVQRLTKPGLSDAIRLRLVQHLPPEEQQALWPLAARRGDQWAEEQLQILLQSPPAQWAERLHAMEMPAARANLALVILQRAKLDEEMWMRVAEEALRELDLLSPFKRADILRQMLFLRPSEPLLDAFLEAVNALEESFDKTSL